LAAQESLAELWKIPPPRRSLIWCFQRAVAQYSTAEVGHLAGPQPDRPA
jgi:hypothetical protein